MRLGLDHSVVSSVQVAVDGVVGCTADYDQPRPDVSYPGIALTGFAPRQFTFTDNCDHSLTGHAICTIKVTFSPTAIGEKTAVLNVNSEADGLRSNTLRGTGT